MSFNRYLLAIIFSIQVSLAFGDDLPEDSNASSPQQNQTASETADEAASLPPLLLPDSSASPTLPVITEYQYVLPIYTARPPLRRNEQPSERTPADIEGVFIVTGISPERAAKMGTYVIAHGGTIRALGDRGEDVEEAAHLHSIYESKWRGRVGLFLAKAYDVQHGVVRDFHKNPSALPTAIILGILEANRWLSNKDLDTWQKILIPTILTFPIGVWANGFPRNWNNFSKKIEESGFRLWCKVRGLPADLPVPDNFMWSAAGTASIIALITAGYLALSPAKYDFAHLGTASVDGFYLVLSQTPLIALLRRQQGRVTAPETIVQYAIAITWFDLVFKAALVSLNLVPINRGDFHEGIEQDMQLLFKTVGDSIQSVANGEGLHNLGSIFGNHLSGSVDHYASVRNIVILTTLAIMQGILFKPLVKIYNGFHIRGFKPFGFIHDIFYVMRLGFDQVWYRVVKYVLRPLVRVWSEVLPQKIRDHEVAKRMESGFRLVEDGAHKIVLALETAVKSNDPQTMQLAIDTLEKQQKEIELPEGVNLSIVPPQALVDPAEKSQVSDEPPAPGPGQCGHAVGGS